MGATCPHMRNYSRYRDVVKLNNTKNTENRKIAFRSSQKTVIFRSFFKRQKAACDRRKLLSCNGLRQSNIGPKSHFVGVGLKTDEIV